MSAFRSVQIGFGWLLIIAAIAGLAADARISGGRHLDGLFPILACGALPVAIKDQLTPRQNLGFVTATAAVVFFCLWAYRLF